MSKRPTNLRNTYTQKSAFLKCVLGLVIGNEWASITGKSCVDKNNWTILWKNKCIKIKVLVSQVVIIVKSDIKVLNYYYFEHSEHHWANGVWDFNRYFPHKVNLLP